MAPPPSSRLGQDGLAEDAGPRPAKAHGTEDRHVAFDGVSMAYPNPESGMAYAIENVTFQQQTGEFCCLLGLSGCGKTTVLNIAAGFLAPTKGTVQIAGRAIERPGPDRAMVFQDYALLPWLTVAANVELGLKLQHLEKAERQYRVRTYLELVGLGDVSKSYPHQLSGGMQQRVSIARALALEPTLLLMDEPFASLDAYTRMQMQRELIRIWQQTKVSVLFVTHSVEEAIFLGDRILFIGGRPGSILHDVKVDLPRPRDRTSGEFNSMEREVLRYLDAEGSKSPSR
jgi:NitT/TauT family transport system ATP-binding protein